MFEMIAPCFLLGVAFCLRSDFNLLVHTREDFVVKNAVDERLYITKFRMEPIEAVPIDVQRVLKSFIDKYFAG